MRYLLYGLRSEADAPLPGLRAAPWEGAAELRITIGSHHPEAASATHPWHRGSRAAPGEETALVIGRAADGGWLRLRYADGTVFTVDAAGTRVGCTWPAPLTAEDMATYLLGPVLGMVLRLHGVSVLHASVAAIDGGAVLVCGPAGAGKSTTAAALAARGHAILSDDVAALDAAPGAITVRPAYPHLRLWPDSVRALYGAGAELPPLTPNWDKRWLDLAAADGSFHATSLPLRAVVLLAGRERAAAPRLEAVAPGDALLDLVANTYAGWLPDLAASGRDLGVYGRIVRELPVVRAVPHADPARLAELCALIEAAPFAAAGGRR